MKKGLLFTLLLAFCMMPVFTKAQTAIEFVDINNINASVLSRGELWFHPGTLMPQCEFPKNSGKHVAFGAAPWIGGYDNNNVLHVSAQTYRQEGNDYWPGPLNTNDTLDAGTSAIWDKIWKIHKTDITHFQSQSTHTLANTPQVILEWPAKNNPYAKGQNGASLTITEEMAPFTDVNQDGKYNPLDGDYPDIKGDQALWWIFSDNGPAHNNTNGKPLKVEFHAMAYAYKNNTTADNIVFYEYTLHNKSSDNYRQFRLGIWNDADLGYFEDDYIGFDSARRLGYIYNGNPSDGTGGGESYGSTPPIAGITFLEMPGDDATTKKPVGSFIYYNNNTSPLGNPLADTEYNHYLRSRFRLGTHLKNDFKGYKQPSTGTGIGPDADYVFPGDPADTSQWSECSSGNTPGDRRMVFSTSDYVFNAGTKTKIIFALVITDRGANHACDNIDITDIKKVADSAWKVHVNPPNTGVRNIAQNRIGLKAYPNPANEKLYVELPAGNHKNAELRIYDVMGRNITPVFTGVNNIIEVATEMLPAGVYRLLYSDSEIQGTAMFTKN